MRLDATVMSKQATSQPRTLAWAVCVVLALRLAQGGLQVAWESGTPTPARDNALYYHGLAADTSPFGQLFLKWDSYWYLHIARWGYTQPPEVTGQAATAFAPLYPYAVRILGWAGVPPDLGGVLLSFICFLGTLPVLYRLGRAVHSERLGVLLVVAYGVFPSSWVLSMVYTEALFGLLMALFLLAYSEGRYARAGLWAALLPFARVAGVVVVPAVIADAAWRSLRERRCCAGFITAIGGLVGIVALFGFFALASADAGAFLGAGQAWFARAGVDGQVFPLLHAIPQRLNDDGFAWLFTAFLALYAGVSVWALLRRRDLFGWLSVLYLFMLLGTPILNAQMRYLLPLFSVHILLLLPLVERPRLCTATFCLLFALQVLLTRGYLTWTLII